MLNKYLATALIGSSLLAPLAFAETPATSDAKPGVTSSNINASTQGEWRASKVVGLSVYNNSDQNVGSINDLLTDKSGAIKTVVIGVGGFLGMGEHLVAVPFDKIKFVEEPLAPAASASNMPNARPPASNTNTNTTTGAATGNTTPPTTTTASSKPDWYPDHAVFNATKDELKAMPEFSYSKEAK
jgi:sporulation protein YlmC with PRC-barrel domain